MKICGRRCWFSGILFLLTVFSCNTKIHSPEASLNSLDLLRGEITLCGDGQFGEVSFPLSCNPDTRESFNLAISLLHSFEYEEAEKAFVKVIDIDPECAMAYWGIAMSNFHSLWFQSGTAYLEKGSKILLTAENLQMSEKERDYLDAIGAFYKDWETTSHTDRIRRFEKRMEDLYLRYENDKEAAIFYALALTASADPNDKRYVNQRKSGKILESIYPDQPNHPGVAHYIIHNYDYPELAALALPTARRYADIAPASAHAQHMPSHIFTRLGLWDESIKSNIQSTAAARCYAESIDPDGHWDEELHGMDYLVYAYLQTGDIDKALEQYNYLKTFHKVFPANFKIAYTAAAIPSRIALETRNWNDAAGLQLPSMGIDWDAFPWQQSILVFARAMGSIHRNEMASANDNLVTLKKLHNVLLERKNEYEANQVSIEINITQAWIYFATGQFQEAIILMQSAAQQEYKTSKHPVTPGEVLPAGELLGDMFMAAKNPREALSAYEFDLIQHPNRFNGLYGAAKAAQQIGDNVKAEHYFRQLLEIVRPSGSIRHEIMEARKFIGPV